MALLIFHPVHALRVLTVYSLERAMQAILVRRNHDQMHMILHQAVRSDVNSKPLGMLAKHVEIRRMVARTEEHALAAIAPLGDMMGYAGKDNARMSGHAQTLPPN